MSVRWSWLRVLLKPFIFTFLMSPYFVSYPGRSVKSQVSNYGCRFVFSLQFCQVFSLYLVVLLVTHPFKIAVLFFVLFFAKLTFLSLWHVHSIPENTFYMEACSDINVSLMFASCYLFPFNSSVCLCLKCVSYKQHTVRL